MKAAEKILMKAAIIQFLFLLLSQLLLHRLDAFPLAKQIAIYEGVAGNSFTKIVETAARK